MYKDVHAEPMGLDQIVLTPDELPTKWYNIIPDIPGGLPPPKEPGDGESRMQALQRRLVKECLRQEASTSRWIDIPEEVRQQLTFVWLERVDDAVAEALETSGAAAGDPPSDAPTPPGAVEAPTG